MLSGVQCRCCGVPVYETRATLRRCMVCDLCDRRHGDELQQHVVALVRAGQITPYHAVARMLLDDALISGALQLIDNGDGTAYAWIPHPPVERWMVVAARAYARNGQPDVQAVVDAVLGRYLPGPATRANLDAIARDLRRALHHIDQNVVNVEVDCKRDALDPQHLLITVECRTADAPGTVTVTAPDAAIPADILSRPRGQA